MQHSEGMQHSEVMHHSDAMQHSEGVQQVDIEMDEDSVQVDVLEDSSNGATTYTSSPYNSEVMKDTTVVSTPAPPTHVTVT